MSGNRGVRRRVVPPARLASRRGGVATASAYRPLCDPGTRDRPRGVRARRGGTSPDTRSGEGAEGAGEAPICLFLRRHRPRRGSTIVPPASAAAPSPTPCALEYRFCFAARGDPPLPRPRAVDHEPGSEKIAEYLGTAAGAAARRISTPAVARPTSCSMRPGATCPSRCARRRPGDAASKLGAGAPPISACLEGWVTNQVRGDGPGSGVPPTAYRFGLNFFAAGSVGDCRPRRSRGRTACGGRS